MSKEKIRCPFCGIGEMRRNERFFVCLNRHVSYLNAIKHIDKIKHYNKERYKEKYGTK